MEQKFFLREAEREARQYIWNFYRGRESMTREAGRSPHSQIGLREAAYFRDYENARAFFATGGAASRVPLIEISEESYEARPITEEVCVVLCEYCLRPRGIDGDAREQRSSMTFRLLPNGGLALCHVHISSSWASPLSGEASEPLAANPVPASVSLALGRKVRRAEDALRDSEEAKGLTPQQKKVLTLLLVGKTYKEVGALLGITGRTVRFHMTKLFQKFGVECREELFAALLDSAGERHLLATAGGEI